jgi:hypothetical protein
MKHLIHIPHGDTGDRIGLIWGAYGALKMGPLERGKRAPLEAPFWLSGAPLGRGPLRPCTFFSRALSKHFPFLLHVVAHTGTQQVITKLVNAQTV